MLHAGSRVFDFDIREGMRPAFITRSQRIALREIARWVAALLNLYSPR